MIFQKSLIIKLSILIFQLHMGSSRNPFFCVHSLWCGQCIMCVCGIFLRSKSNGGIYMHVENTTTFFLILSLSSSSNSNYISCFIAAPFLMFVSLLVRCMQSASERVIKYKKKRDMCVHCLVLEVYISIIHAAYQCILTLFCKLQQSFSCLYLLYKDIQFYLQKMLQLILSNLLKYTLLHVILSIIVLIRCIQLIIVGNIKVVDRFCFGFIALYLYGWIGCMMRA